MESNNAPSKLGYRPELDGLRALAVSAVIVYHFWGDTPLFGRSRSWSPSFGGGFLGVDLFFVLSGFLITRLLLEESSAVGRISLGAFYGRRAARLLPALGVLLVVVVAYVWLRADRRWSEVALGVIGSATYSANWMLVAGRDLEPLGHMWSLSVEEQFYVAWPLVVVALGASLRRLRVVAGWVVLLSAVSMVVRSLAGVSTNTLLYSTDSRGALALMSGCFLATCHVATSPADGRQTGVRWATVAGSLVLSWLVLFSAKDVGFMVRGGFVIAVAAILAVVIGTLRLPGLRSVLSLDPLVWVGRLSYGLYLWHKVVYAYLRDFVGSRLEGGRYNVACGAVALAIAAFSYYVVEMPIRRWAGVHIRRLAARSARQSARGVSVRGA